MLLCAFPLPPNPTSLIVPLLFIGWFFLFILLSVLNYKRNPKRGVLDFFFSTPLLAVSTSSHLHKAEHIESGSSLASSLTDLTLFLETHFPAQICTCFVISPVSPQVVWNSKTAVLVKRGPASIYISALLPWEGRSTLLLAGPCTHLIPTLEHRPSLSNKCFICMARGSFSVFSLTGSQLSLRDCQPLGCLTLLYWPRALPGSVWKACLPDVWPHWRPARTGLSV